MFFVDAYRSISFHLIPSQAEKEPEASKAQVAEAPKEPIPEPGATEK